MDTSGQALCAAAAGKGAFLLKVNLREFRQLTGKDLEDELEQEEAALDMVRSGKCEVLVVSLGSAGALAASARGLERFRSPTVPIRSRVGAGDSMVAGIVLSLVRDLPLAEAVRFGVAAGAAAVMNAGTELSRREDAERLYSRLSREAVCADTV